MAKVIKSFILTMFLTVLIIVNNQVCVFANEDKVIPISPEEIINLYKEDNKNANETFRDKTIEIEGIVDSITKNFYQVKVNIKVLDNNLIVCKFASNEKKLSNIKENQNVCIQGICRGRLGNNLYIDQCIIN